MILRSTLLINNQGKNIWEQNDWIVLHLDLLIEKQTHETLTLFLFTDP